MWRIYLCTVRLLSLLKYRAIVHGFAFILVQLSVGQAQEEYLMYTRWWYLILFAVEVCRHRHIF